MNHVVSFSSGLSSAITAVRVLDKYPGAKLVFMDTLFEDESNYRFMASFENKFGVKIIRLTEGRNPYEVSRDEHVIPNNFLAPCTFRLKIEPFREYLKSLIGDTTIYIGYDYSEMHRCEATSKNYKALGYDVDYPLLWNPVEYRKYTDVVRSDWDIQPPRMYQLGYTHANCGGRCVKQGQGDWIRTLINFPERFAEIETWEKNMQENEVNSKYALLKTQTQEGRKPMTLTELRERYEREHNEPSFLDTFSSCVVCGIGG